MRKEDVIRHADRLSLDVDLTLLEHEVLADHPLPDVLHVLDNSLEVRGRVVRTSDEDVVVLAVCCGSVQRRDGNESGQRRGVISMLYLEQSSDDYTYLS